MSEISSQRRARDFWVHVGEDRAAMFRAVFGTSIVPITSPRAHMACLPGFADPQEVYLLDLDWVAEQGHRESLIAHLAERFGTDAREVERDLDTIGMPVLAAGTTLRIDHPQRWLG